MLHSTHLHCDLTTGEVHTPNGVYTIADKHLDVLALLMLNHGYTFSRQQVADVVWGGYAGDSTVRNVIYALRTKIGDYVKTKYGYGYYVD